MSTKDEINAENALRHARADTDSSRAELQRLARVIAAERDKAQVVLSQKGVLESINRDLLAALKWAMPFCPTPKGTEPIKYIEAYDAAHTAMAKAEEPITS